MTQWFDMRSLYGLLTHHCLIWVFITLFYLVAQCFFLRDKWNLLLCSILNLQCQTIHKQCSQRNNGTCCKQCFNEAELICSWRKFISSDRHSVMSRNHAPLLHIKEFVGWSRSCFRCGYIQLDSTHFSEIIRQLAAFAWASETGYMSSFPKVMILTPH